MAFFRVLRVGLFTLFCGQVGGVGLTSFSGLFVGEPVGTFPPIVGLVGDESELPTEERFVGSKGVGVSVRNRHRHAKGQNNHRRRCVEELCVFAPRANALYCAGAVLLVCGRGAGE